MFAIIGLLLILCLVVFVSRLPEEKEPVKQKCKPCKCPSSRKVN